MHYNKHYINIPVPYNIYIYMGKCMSNILNFEENIYCDLYPRICIYIYIYIHYITH